MTLIRYNRQQETDITPSEDHLSCPAPQKNRGLEQELLDIVGGRSPGRQRKKPRKKSSPLGEALTALRVKSGFTQAELADACGPTNVGSP